MINWFKQKQLSFQNISEGRLIESIKQGKKEAFGKLYLKYIDAIYRYTYFRVNQDQSTAEDLTQAVFYKAWQNMNKYDPKKGTFRSWIYAIAHNVVIDFYRSREGILTGIEQMNIADDEPLIEDALDRKDKIESIQQALLFLTDEQKSVITMRFIEEMSHQEIAKILQKDEDAIRALQYRGLQKLRTLLNKS